MTTTYQTSYTQHKRLYRYINLAQADTTQMDKVVRGQNSKFHGEHLGIVRITAQNDLNQQLHLHQHVAHSSPW